MVDNTAVSLRYPSTSLALHRGESERTQLFTDQTFLLKIHPSECNADVPVSESGFSLLDPTFKFFCSRKVGFRIEREREGGRIRLIVGDLSLKGFELTWDPVSGVLRILTDRFSLYPVLLVRAKDGGIWISNTSSYFARFLEDFRFDEEAVNQLFSFGFLLPGQHLMSGIHRVHQEWSFDFRTGWGFPSGTSCLWKASDFIPCPSFEEPPARSIAATEAALKHCLSEIMAIARPEEFRMSGGADSRLISLLLSDEQLRSMRIRIVTCDWLKPEEDLDFQVARRWCEENRWPYEVHIAGPRHSAVFDGAVDQCVLSGLYGGEFLGDIYRRLMPDGLLNPRIDHALSPRGEALVIGRAEAFNSMSAQERSWAARQVFTHSDRSLINMNVETGWACPSSNLRVSISPFATVPGINDLFQLPDSELRDYRHFARVLAHCEGDRRFPICSQFTLKFPEWSPPSDWGVEPKARRPIPSAPQLHPRERYGPIIEVLAARGVAVDSDRFIRNLDDKYFRAACRNFTFAFPRLFDVR